MAADASAGWGWCETASGGRRSSAVSAAGKQRAEGRPRHPAWLPNPLRCDASTPCVPLYPLLPSTASEGALSSPTNAATHTGSRSRACRHQTQPRSCSNSPDTCSSWRAEPSAGWKAEAGSRGGREGRPNGGGAAGEVAWRRGTACHPGAVRASGGLPIQAPAPKAPPTRPQLPRLKLQRLPALLPG